MPRAVKYIAALAALIVLALAAAIGYVLIGIDPNSFKPQLEEAAKNQGIQLELQGELGWSLFPRLALHTGKIHFSSEEHRIPPSSMNSAALELEWGPILRKQIAINALRIEGADLHFTSVEQAGALAAPAAPAEQQQTLSGTGFSLSIRRIEIEDSRFTLHEEGGSRQIDHLNLASKGINPRGEPFPLEASFSYTHPGDSTPIRTSTTLEAAYDPHTGLVSLTGVQLEFQDWLPETLALQFDGAMDINTQSASIRGLKATLGSLRLAGETSIARFNTSPEFTGKLRVDSDNLRDTLANIFPTGVNTRNPEALKQFSAATEFAATAHTLSLDNLKLRLDGSDFAGNVRLRLGETRKLQASLTGTHLNLDDYQTSSQPLSQTPGDQETALAAEESPQPVLSPLLVPLALLDGGSGNIHLALDSLVTGGMVLSAPEFSLDVEGTRAQVRDLTFGVFGGTVKADSTLQTGRYGDFSGSEPQLAFTLAAENISLREARQQFGETSNLSGDLDLNIQGSTRGSTVEDMKNHIRASGNLRLDNPHLASINLEQSYCELAAAVEKTPARAQPWPLGTRLETLHSSFSLQGHLLTLANYSTGVGNLKARGDGEIDLGRETFNLRVIANLQGDRTSASGCAVKSKRIRNRDIPLQCKDNFATAGNNSCKPDPDFVRQLLQEEVLDRVRANTGDDEKVKAVEGLLKGLFKK